MSYILKLDDATRKYVRNISIAVGCGFVFLWAFSVFVSPFLNIWQAKMRGEATVITARMEGEAAKLKAEQTRQIIVTQAIAEKDAAGQRAQAIEIVGKSAKLYPEYRQQEFIGAFAEALKDGKINQIMYIPTEASIPITEAGHK